MREAEEEERLEQEQKRLQEPRSVSNLNAPPAPAVTEIDDETLFEEARRRAAQAKQQ
jgi:hypothetical protein